LPALNLVDLLWNELSKKKFVNKVYDLLPAVIYQISYGSNAIQTKESVISSPPFSFTREKMRWRPWPKEVSASWREKRKLERISFAGEFAFSPPNIPLIYKYWYWVSREFCWIRVKAAT